jgi:hypothetical protein
LDYEAVAKHPLISKAFLAGSRPFLIPLIWKFTGTPKSFVGFETLFSVVSWSILAFTVSSKMQGRVGKIVSGLAILAFALAPQIEIWDQGVLSDSMALSFIALLIAEGLLLQRNSNIARYVILSLTLIGFALARDENNAAILLAVFLIMIVVCVIRVLGVLGISA